MTPHLDVPVGGPKELFTACSPDLAIGSRDGDHLVDNLGSGGGRVHIERNVTGLLDRADSMFIVVDCDLHDL